MNEIKKIRTKLVELMHEEGINETELAQRSGVAQSTVNRILSGKIPDPKYGTLENLFRNLGSSLKEVLIDTSWGIQEDTKNNYTTNADIPILTFTDYIKGNPAKNYIKCPFSHGPNTFAFMITTPTNVDHPMQATRGISFPSGAIVFADKDQEPKNGDAVVAYIPTRKAIAFSIYYNENGQKYLAPLNSQFPPMFDEFEIKARVIGSILPL